MNFKEIEDLENQVASNEFIASSGYQSFIITEYLEKENKKNGAKNNPFVYFYEDVIMTSISFNFQPAIGQLHYKNASDDALACLNLCLEFRKLSHWEISGWLNNALKFIDNIVLHYIQDICKELPAKHKDAGTEKSRYIQLSLKENREISVAGSELKDLYDLRNNFEHRTKIFPDGKQELITPNRNKARKEVVKLYKDALIRILRTYKNEFPDLIC